MSTKYNRNFTNFQNVGLRGTMTPDGIPSPGMLEMTEGATNAASTISVSMISGSTAGSENGAVEAPYFHISNAGLSIGTGFIRITSSGSSPFTTFAVSARHDRDAAFTWPAKPSGIFPVMGTLIVGLESIAANQVYSTNVVPANSRADDAYIWHITRLNGSATTRGQPVFIGSTPTNSGVELLFLNPTATATAAGSFEMGFVRIR